MSDNEKKKQEHKQGQPKGDKQSKQQKPKKQGAPAAAKSQAKPKAPAAPAPPPRLRDRYRAEIAPKMKQEFGVKNPMALPRLDKVILTVGLGKQLEGTKLNPKAKEQVLKTLAVVTGQKAVVTKAKKSVANFKVRAGYEIGAMVTLRGTQMWEFVDRLICLSIPRIKDFRGLSPKSFDKGGNYSFGVTEQGIFPEVNMAEAEFTHGMNVTFCFSNSNKDRSLFALKEMGVPFMKPQDMAKKN